MGMNADPFWKAKNWVQTQLVSSYFTFIPGIRDGKVNFWRGWELERKRDKMSALKEFHLEFTSPWQSLLISGLKNT